MFSRIRRSVYQSSLTKINKGAFCGVRSSIVHESSSGNAYNLYENGGLGFLRSYLTSMGAGKQALKSPTLKEFNSIFRNPKLRRLFCSQAPKKKYEKYDPKNKTEIPKENKNKNNQKKPRSILPDIIEGVKKMEKNSVKIAIILTLLIYPPVLLSMLDLREKPALKTNSLNQEDRLALKLDEPLTDDVGSTEGTY